MQLFVFAGLYFLMAKSKSLKPETKPPKRKKLSPITNEKDVGEMIDTPVKKKKKKVEVSSIASSSFNWSEMGKVKTTACLFNSGGSTAEFWCDNSNRW